MGTTAPKEGALQAAAEGAKPGLPTSSQANGARHLDQPIERHLLIPDDKLVLTPSPRRPRQRDLERLVAHFAGWGR